MTTSTAGPGNAGPPHEVDRILAASNFFERLGLSCQEISSVEVRKRYRRVALRCHPDKVSHPRAKAAFQLLSEAFDCLHDDVQQSIYIDKLKSQAARNAERAKKAKNKKKQWNKPKSFGYNSNNNRESGARPGQGGRKRKKPTDAKTTASTSGAKTKSWQEVEEDLRRREEAEARLRAQFRGQKSRAFSDRALLSFHQRMQKICQTLDERKGIPRHNLWMPEPAPLPSSTVDSFAHTIRPGRVAAMEAEMQAAAAAGNVPTPPPTPQEALVAMEKLLHYLHDEHNYIDLDDEYFEHAWKPPPQAQQTDCKGASRRTCNGTNRSEAGSQAKKNKVYDY